MYAPRHRMNPTPIHLGIATLSALGLALGTAGSANAQVNPPVVLAQVADYDLPVAPLRVTLAAIARLSGLPIEVDRTVPDTQLGAEVKGRMNGRDALSRAVAGSGLTFDFSGSAWLVRDQSSVPAIQIVAKRNQAETGFKADRSDTATRSGTDLMDVPMAVTVLTAKVLQSQQATSTLEALRNVSGVGLAQSPQGLPEFQVRGFTSTSQTTNGIADRNSAQADIVTIERIEVLKGPQAILAGGDSLGGGVNVVTKKPSSEAFREGSMQIGTRADLTASLDLTGAVSDDGPWSYRLIASGVRSGATTTGFDGRSSEGLMPALRFKDRETDLTLSASYSRNRLPTPEYTLALADGKIAPTPSFRLGAADDGFSNRHLRLGYDLERSLSSGAKLVSRMQVVSDRLFLHLWSPVFQSVDQSGSVLGTFAPINDTTDSRQISGDHYFRLTGETGSLSHKLSVGFGHDRFHSEQVQYAGDPVDLALFPAQAVLLPNPKEVQQDPSTYVARNRQEAIYAQDLVAYGDWNFLLNWRRTRYTQSQTAAFGTDVQTFGPTSVFANTPGGGVVYRWSDATSLYGSYSEGFVPQTSPLCSGGITPPILSKNKEVGAKFQLNGGRLGLTAAAYQIDQSNSPISVFPGNCVEVKPGRTTKGIELDVQGEVATDWNLLGNYTYATVSEAQNPTARIPGAPRHKLSLWATTKLRMPGWQGLGMGLGLTSASRMAGNNDVTQPFDIPGQSQIDASLSYEQPAWSVNLGIKNLTNRRLYGVSNFNVFVPVLSGRSVLLSVRRRFD